TAMNYIRKTGVINMYKNVNSPSQAGNIGQRLQACENVAKSMLCDVFSSNMNFLLIARKIKIM
ncbi:MAG: hypothetical protein IKS98_06450, partial [Lachnospiraceae bacterium]|nr:hypothetical protein [Lachnospiraceae bacterium]